MTDFNFDIWRMQSQGDIAGLMTYLRHPTPDVRRHAATSLRALGAAGAIPALQTALIAESDSGVRTIIISALDYLFEQASDPDNREAIERQHKVVQWIAQLASDKPEQIIRAAQNLADMKEKLATEALILVFRNRAHSPRVRLEAAEALLKLESAPIEVTLLAALRNPDWHTRRNAAGVLGQLHADWAVEPLTTALHDSNEIVRRIAHAALERIDTPEARRALETPLITDEFVAVKVEPTPEASTKPSEAIQTPETPTSAAQALAVETKPSPVETSAAPESPKQPETALPTAEVSKPVEVQSPVVEVQSPVSAPMTLPTAPVPQLDGLTLPVEIQLPDPSPVFEPSTSADPTPAVSEPAAAALTTGAPDLPTAPQIDIPIEPLPFDPEQKKTSDLTPQTPEMMLSLAPAPASADLAAIPPMADEDTQPVKPVLGEDVS